MAVVIQTTDANRSYLPMDFFITNYNRSLPVNSKGSFSIHYAIWPFIGLISLIVSVWVAVYISMSFTRRRNSKNEHRHFASLYVTQDSTIAGGNEASTVVLPTDV